MNITRENREGQVSVIKVTVGESDYNEAVEKKLREYRRKANMPGFRPGMVPMSIINKTYRKSTIAETAYKMASDAVFEYLDKEKIDSVSYTHLTLPTSLRRNARGLPHQFPAPLRPAG